MTKCNCKDWQPNIDKINSAITMDFVHGKEYTGKPFEYCPWCGKKLEKDSE